VILGTKPNPTAQWTTYTWATLPGWEIEVKYDKSEAALSFMASTMLELDFDDLDRLSTAYSLARTDDQANADLAEFLENVGFVHPTVSRRVVGFMVRALDW
jgi:hypothetical protein